MNIQFMDILTGWIVLLPMILIFTLMPYLTRRDLCFGISIPTMNWTDDYLKKLRRTHSLIVCIIGIILLVVNTIAVSALDELTAQYVMMGILFGYLAIYAVIYLVSWRKTKSYKQQMNWKTQKTSIVIADTSKSIKTRSINPLWYLIHAGAIAATYFASLNWYKSAPDILPLQYDFNGNITNSVPKSMNVVYEFLLIQVVMFALFLGINMLISRAKETYDPENPKISANQNKKMKLRWSKYIYFMGLCMILLFTFAIYSILNPIDPKIIMIVPMAFVLLIVAGTIILSVNTGQSGSHIDKDDIKLNDKINRDDDEYWKLGSLYYNPDDPAIFVEKRHGIGWTNNWARWQSWAVILAVFGLIVFSVIKSF